MAGKVGYNVAWSEESAAAFLQSRPVKAAHTVSAAGRRRRSGPGEDVENEAGHTSLPPVDHGGKKLTGCAIASSSPLLKQSQLSEK